MKQDNELAFSCLIDRYNPVLFRHVLRRTQSAVDTQEILQDIFISLWNKRHSLYVEETIYPYLFRAAKYEVIDWYVKTEKRLIKEAVLLTGEYQVEFPAEDFLLASELSALLDAEIAKMPYNMKTIFQLSREDLLTAKEIAHRLSLSEQTVKNNITIALKRLRYTLRHEHYVIISAVFLSGLH